MEKKSKREGYSYNKSKGNESKSNSYSCNKGERKGVIVIVKGRG